VELTQVLTDQLSTGVVEGAGFTSIVGDSELDIAQGRGYINDLDTGSQNIEVSWATSSNIVSLSAGDNFIYVDKNGIFSSVGSFNKTPEKIYLGFVYFLGGVIQVISYIPVEAHNPAFHTDHWMKEAVGPLCPVGNLTSNSGAGLDLTVTGGEVYIGSFEHEVSDTSSWPGTWYLTSDEGWKITASPNAVQPALWNDVTEPAAGSPTKAVVGGEWTKALVLRTIDGNIQVIMGQENFASESDAQDGAFPMIPPSIASSGGVRVSSIVMEGTDANLTGRLEDIRPNMDRVFGFGTSGTVGTLAVHSGLVGLGSDDHLQYARTDGGRTFTGSLLMGGNSITGTDLSLGPVRADGTGKLISGNITWSEVTKTGSDLADLLTRSHTDLTDIGTNTHAQIDTAVTNSTNHISDVAKHREINDAGSGTTDLWSANKIATEISSSFDAAFFQHVVGAAVSGGTLIGGSWNVRTLNTTLYSNGTTIVRSGNQITLDAGTYQIQGGFVGHDIDGNQLRLRNVTDGTTTLLGPSVEFRDIKSGKTVVSQSTISGIIVVPGAKTYQIEHWATTTQNTNGAGKPSGSAENNVYGHLLIEKKA